MVLDQNLTEDFEPVLISVKCKGLAFFELGGSGRRLIQLRFVSRGMLRSVSVVNGKQAADVAGC